MLLNFGPFHPLGGGGCICRAAAWRRAVMVIAWPLGVILTNTAAAPWKGKPPFLLLLIGLGNGVFWSLSKTSGDKTFPLRSPFPLSERRPLLSFGVSRCRPMDWAGLSLTWYSRSCFIWPGASTYCPQSGHVLPPRVDSVLDQCPCRASSLAYVIIGNIGGGRHGYTRRLEREALDVYSSVPPSRLCGRYVCQPRWKRTKSCSFPGFPSHGAALLGNACSVFVVKPERATPTYNL